MSDMKEEILRKVMNEYQKTPVGEFETREAVSLAIKFALAESEKEITHWKNEVQIRIDQRDELGSKLGRIFERIEKEVKDLSGLLQDGLTDYQWHKKLALERLLRDLKEEFK